MNDDLLRRIGLLLDGELSDADTAALYRRAAEDPAVADALTLATMLHTQVGEQLRSERSEAIGHDRSLSHRGTAGAGEPPHANRIRNASFAYSVAAALLLSAAAGAIYVLAFNPQSEVRAPESTDRAIATLIDATGDVIVDDDIANPGAEIRARTVSIASGAAEFLLTNSVGITITSDTAITMHSDMAATMIHGVAEFTCPPGAKGYTVYLPDGSRIVDLGTAFRVAVDDAGRTRLSVTKGEVQWTRHVDDSDLAAAESTVLRTGERAWIADGRLEAIHEVLLFADGFESGKSLDGWTGAGAVPGESTGSVPSPWIKAGAHAGTVWLSTDWYPGGNAEGDICLYLNQLTHISRTLNVGLRPNTIYTLTVAVGNRVDHNFPGYGVELWAGEQLIASNYDALHGGDGAAPDAGEWKDVAATVTTGDSVPSHPLEIRLLGYGTQTNYDHVRLSAAGVGLTPAPPQTPANVTGDER